MVLDETQLRSLARDMWASHNGEPHMWLELPATTRDWYLRLARVAAASIQRELERTSA